MLTVKESERGERSHFLVKDLGLALARKMCPDQSQAFKGVNHGQANTVGEKENGMSSFLAEPLSGAPRHVRRKFGANIRTTDSVGPVLSQIENLKNYIYQNQVITMPTRDFCTLSRKRQVFTMFLRDRPCDLARMFRDPLPILLRMAANLQPLNTRRRRGELK